MNIIILTGPKHSGKSSAGKALASILHSKNDQAVNTTTACTFIDIDELITQQTGQTPRQLFSKDPSIFKKAEAQAVSSIISMTHTAEKTSTDQKNNFLIIAAGGGIIDNAEALIALKKLDAAIVYLNISADLAWNRIIDSVPTSTDGKTKELPPFLQTENPQETHRALHERRASAYRQIADIIIDAENKTPDQVAVELLDTISSIK